MLAALDAASAPTEHGLRALLGDRYEEFKAAERVSEMAVLIDNTVGLDLAFAGAPLSDVQSDQLAGLFRDAHLISTDPLFTDVIRQPARAGAEMLPVEEIILEQAHGFLSAAQLAALRQSFVDRYRSTSRGP